LNDRDASVAEIVEANGNTKNTKDSQRARVLAGERGAGRARHYRRRHRRASALRQSLLEPYDLVIFV
jgi:hypothetical protein